MPGSNAVELRLEYFKDTFPSNDENLGIVSYDEGIEQEVNSHKSIENIWNTLTNEDVLFLCEYTNDKKGNIFHKFIELKFDGPSSLLQSPYFLIDAIFTKLKACKLTSQQYFDILFAKNKPADGSTSQTPLEMMENLSFATHWTDCNRNHVILKLLSNIIDIVGEEMLKEKGSWDILHSQRSSIEKKIKAHTDEVMSYATATRGIAVSTQTKL